MSQVENIDCIPLLRTRLVLDPGTCSHYVVPTPLPLVLSSSTSLGLERSVMLQFRLRSYMAYMG